MMASRPIYYVTVTRLDGDNREYTDDADPGVFYLSRERAQAEADRLNVDVMERRRRKHADGVARYERDKAEWEALRAAGLREGAFRVPPPTEPREGGEDWHGVDEAELIEDPGMVGHEIAREVVRRYNGAALRSRSLYNIVRESVIDHFDGVTT